MGTVIALKFSSELCGGSEESEAAAKKSQKTTKPPISDAEFQSDLKTLTAMQLRKKYPHEANSHKNMKSRAKKKGYDLDPKLIDWKSFLRIMGQKPSADHTIDRTDNTKGYVLGNVAWADPVTQNNNKGNNVTLCPVKGGPTKTLSQWAKETGQSCSTLYGRKSKGWTPFEIVYGRSATTKGTPSAAELLQWGLLRPNFVPHNQPWPTAGIREGYHQCSIKSFGQKIPPTVWLAGYSQRKSWAVSREIQDYLDPVFNPDLKIPESLERAYDRLHELLGKSAPLAIAWYQQKGLPRAEAIRWIRYVGERIP